MLQAKINGKWGAMPPHLKTELPEDGTIVTFEFSESYTEFGTGRKRWNAQEHLRSIVPVQDPKTRETVLVGVFDQTDNEGNPVPASIPFIVAHPDSGKGLMHYVVGTSTRVNDILRLLLISSERADSPFRDKGIRPLYRLKDHKLEAEARVRRITLEHEAIRSALTIKDYKDLASLLGIASAEEAIVRSELAEYARKNPEAFMACIADEDKAVKALIASALDAGVVSINEELPAIVNVTNGMTIVPLTGTSRPQILQDFADHVRNDPKGKSMATQIETLVNLSRKKK